MSKQIFVVPIINSQCKIFMKFQESREQAKTISLGRGNPK